MPQVLQQQGNIFGRLGAGIGQGLASTIPEEVDRSRLASGLKRFAENAPNQTALQNFAQFSSIPGTTASMHQAYPEVAKQDSLRNYYRGEQQPSSMKPEVGKNFRDVQFANQGQKVPRGTNAPPPEAEFGQPQIVQDNPLREEAVPKAPWTQDKVNRRIGQISDQYPNVPIQEIRNMVAQEEQRDLASPLAEQAKDTYFTQKQEQLNKKFDDFLQTKLQKDEKGVFQDITGENLVNMRRGMERDLRADPKATIDDVADLWSKKALDLAKTKSDLRGLKESSKFAIPLLMNKEENRKKLDQYAKAFSESGNSEEYYNTLKSDFKMSPEAAAYIAYPRSPRTQNYINKRKNQLTNDEKSSENSRKAAIDLENLITSNDSLLALAWDLRYKDPNFKVNDFINQLREDQDLIGLNQRQKRELATGFSLLPNWSDLLFLPVFRSLK